MVIKIIKKPEDLEIFLKDKAKTHKRFNHYTTSSILNLILNNKTLRLTRGNSEILNDWHERNRKGVEEEWNNTYIACFASDNYENYIDENKVNYDSENMAMWGLYGLLSNEAVRITLPCNKMKRLINISQDKLKNNENFIFTEGIRNVENAVSNDKIKSITLTDVFYVKGTNKDIIPPEQKHIQTVLKFNTNNLHNYFMKKDFTGFVKNYAWNYEKETRIIVKLNKPIDKEFLYIELPDEVIKSFQITLGPNYPRNKTDGKDEDTFLSDFLDSLPKEYNFNLNNCRRSLFDGLVHFKSEYENNKQGVEN